ncbi:hypothetical protein K435DRAFT_462131 [Dendrothele bispora CBS 962.96]|uniref:Uncharacterized protein n=1 Tax=Dendrothele bispora (strain CBS 962.96) TaxID=1314807 RepID=A0A4S8MCN4_DENBC|nr:hypothetical protein K435DRAFT_462131 [Dendrothele bispora CBS 962.96]
MNQFLCQRFDSNLRITKVYFHDDHTLSYGKESFSRIIQRLLALVKNPFHPYFFFNFDTTIFRHIVVTHFIQQMARSGHSLESRRLLATSGIMELIVEVMRLSMRPPSST